MNTLQSMSAKQQWWLDWQRVGFIEIWAVRACHMMSDVGPRISLTAENLHIKSMYQIRIWEYMCHWLCYKQQFRTPYLIPLCFIMSTPRHIELFTSLGHILTNNSPRMWRVSCQRGKRPLIGNRSLKCTTEIGNDIAYIINADRDLRENTSLNK
jgi:hypothetical protein